MNTEIEFSSTNVFDSRGASQLCWRARLRYFERLISDAITADARSKRIPLLLSEFLAALGILNSKLQVAPAFLLSWQQSEIWLAKRSKKRGRDLRIASITLAVLERATSLSGYGMSGAVAVECASWISTILGRPADTTGSNAH
jgi:hypothetical protein